MVYRKDTFVGIGRFSGIYYFNDTSREGIRARAGELFSAYLFSQNALQRLAPSRSGELRNRIFSTKIIFLAIEKREFTTYFAISQNRC